MLLLLAVQVVVEVLDMGQVEVVLVDIKQAQHQLEHIQYQQLFRLVQEARVDLRSQHLQIIKV